MERGKGKDIVAEKVKVIVGEKGKRYRRKERKAV
jgi:hypothetical protein